MITLKEHIELEENVAVSLIWTIVKDLTKISYNITKFGLKSGVKLSSAIHNRYNKQAIADRKAEKAIKKAAKLTRYKDSKKALLKAQEKIKKEQQRIKTLSAVEKRRHQAEIAKTTQQLKDFAKQLKAAEKRLPV